MATTTTTVTGLDTLDRDLQRFCAPGGRIDTALSEAAAHVATPVASVTRSRLPQISGRLSGQVQVRRTRSGAQIVVGSTNLRYAGWVEFGGHRRVPHASYRQYSSIGRYLWPAARDLPGTGLAAYSDALASTLDGLPWTNTAVPA